MDPKTLTVVELRKELSARSLDTSGLKNALALRLQAALDEEEFGDLGGDAVAPSDETHAAASAAAAAGAAAKAKALSVPEEQAPAAPKKSLEPGPTLESLASADQPTRPEENDDEDDDEDAASADDDDDEEGGARARRGKRSATERSAEELPPSSTLEPSNGAADLGDSVTAAAVVNPADDEVASEESAAARAKRLKRAERFGLDPETADTPAEKAARAEAAKVAARAAEKAAKEEAAAAKAAEIAAAREAHLAAGGCAGCQFKKHSVPMPLHYTALDEPYCCTKCRLTKGRQHGGNCERWEVGKDEAPSTSSSSSSSSRGGAAAEAVLKSITAIDPSLPWSERKRLMVMAKANGQWGDQAFVPPPDPKDQLPGEGDSEEAIALQAKRRARFGEAAPLDPEAAAAAAKARADAAAAEAAKKASRAAKFGLELPDPVEVAAAEARAAKAALLGQLKLKPHQVFGADPLRLDPPRQFWTTKKENDPRPDAAEGESSGADAHACPTKLHLFCLAVDSEPMKKMRSPDLMLYLKAYHPTYIEWLSDRTCNVHFADHAAALRAYETLFKELPEPPPRKVVADKKQHGKHRNKKGAAAASSSSSFVMPDPPLDAGSHAAAAFQLVQSYYATVAAAAAAAGNTQQTLSSPPPVQLPPWPPLGAYGWKLGPPLTKAANDKFGSAGLSARLLCRFATSLDVLAEKPPPPPSYARGRGGGGGEHYSESGNSKRPKKQQRGHSVILETRPAIATAAASASDAASNDGTKPTAAPRAPRPVLPATSPTERRVASAAFAAAFKDPKRKQAVGLAPEEVNPKLRRLVMNADGSLARKPKRGAVKSTEAAAADGAASASAASAEIVAETTKEAPSSSSNRNDAAANNDDGGQ